MRVLLLGAAGTTGSWAAALIADLEGVRGLCLADLNLAAVERLADELAAHHPEVSIEPAGIDVTERHELAVLIGRHDLVVNMVGPYYRFGVPVMSAAIAAGVDYIDVCDDWEPTVDMFELGGAAHATGSTCIVGMGASPGVSNLLALLATRDMDRVVDVVTAWPVDVDDDSDDGVTVDPGSAPGAATVHWMLQLSGSIKTVEHGQIVDSVPLQPMKLTAPGHGRGTVYTVGHPEPITLRRTLNIQGRCVNAMVVTAGTVAFLDDLRQRVDRGEFTLEQAAAAIESPSPSLVVKAGLHSLGRSGPGRLPHFFALATGSGPHGEVSVCATVQLPPAMAPATAVPLAIVVGHWLNGNLPRTPGVFAPEEIVDADRFFEDLEGHVVGGAQMKLHSHAIG
ncbi:MAG: saccharopine dehydrogenase family protein [Actinomycetes bacterium]